MIRNSEYLRKMECPVCLNILTDSVELSCLHVYCNNCVKDCIQYFQGKCYLCHDPIQQISDKPCKILASLINRVRTKKNRLEKIISEVEQVLIILGDQNPHKIKIIELELDFLKVIRDRMILTLDKAGIVKNEKVKANLSKLDLWELQTHLIYDSSDLYSASQVRLNLRVTQIDKFKDLKRIATWKNQVYVGTSEGVYQDRKKIYYGENFGMTFSEAGYWIKSYYIWYYSDWTGFNSGNLHLRSSEHAVCMGENLVVADPLRCITPQEKIIWSTRIDVSKCLSVRGANCIFLNSGGQICEYTHKDLIVRKQLGAQDQLVLTDFGAVSSDYRRNIFFWDLEWNLICLWNPKGDILISVPGGLVKITSLSRDFGEILSLASRTGQILIGAPGRIFYLDY